MIHRIILALSVQSAFACNPGGVVFLHGTASAGKSISVKSLKSITRLGKW